MGVKSLLLLIADAFVDKLTATKSDASQKLTSYCWLGPSATGSCGGDACALVTSPGLIPLGPGVGCSSSVTENVKDPRAGGCVKPGKPNK
ncbi:hypothetical protein SFRURICE_000254 [Spodoptera frugiperda]|nr:hypothetical protein SFRURICE_000254 [Spodoptera frugiperda]